MPETARQRHPKGSPGVATDILEGGNALRVTVHYRPGFHPTTVKLDEDGDVIFEDENGDGMIFDMRELRLLFNYAVRLRRQWETEHAE